MRYRILLLVFVGLFFLGGKNSDFLIVSATKQSWHGGRPGSAGGVNYSFSFVAKKSSEKLIIDQLWVKDKLIKLDRVIFMGGTDAQNFSKNDTLRYKGSEKLLPLTARLGDKQKEQETDQPKPPFEYEGDALIGYKTGKKRKYKVLQKFKTLKSINAP